VGDREALTSGNSRTGERRDLPVTSGRTSRYWFVRRIGILAPAVDAIIHRGNRKNMSMLRKTTITVAIVGAGLGSLSGAAFASPHHGSSHESHGSSHDSHGSSCTNNVKALNASESGGFVNIAGGAQTVVAANVCHILDDNKILNGNSVHIG
jgi:hypothetical protein